MSTELSEQPEEGAEVVDGDGDRWIRTGTDWQCLNITTPDRTWAELVEFGPVRLVVGAPALDGREFEVRRTALLAAAAIVGGSPERYEAGYEEKDVTDLARSFEPYLRGASPDA